jgi:hypothetical protein
MTKPAVLVLSLVVIVLRFVRSTPPWLEPPMPPGLDSHDFYKDLAHLWFGSVVGAGAALAFHLRRVEYHHECSVRRTAVFCGLVASAMLAAEVVAFVMR